jgi:hypothetical protein
MPGRVVEGIPVAPNTADLDVIKAAFALEEMLISR